MNIIKDIMNDFYNCCNLPVIAIDSNLKYICKVGYNDYLDKVTNLDLILKDISLGDKPYLTLKYGSDFNFVVTNISRFNKYRGYFIIGPFSNTDNGVLPFKPLNCIDYLPYIITTISDTVFSKGMSNLSYSIHTRKAISYVHTNYNSDVNIDLLCDNLDINKSYFCKIFKKETGFTFSNFVNNYRVEKSKDLLLNTSYSLLDIAVLVGFNTQNYYSSVFKKLANMSPLEYRKSKV